MHFQIAGIFNFCHPEPFDSAQGEHDFVMPKDMLVSAHRTKTYPSARDDNVLGLYRRLSASIGGFKKLVQDIRKLSTSP
jgi:hypothetical protein